MIIDNNAVSIKGHVKIFDPNSGEIILDKSNAIHYSNMSFALASTLANKSIGQLYKMSFGNGGSTVDPTGVIVYLPPNTVGQQADLYNETFYKVIDDQSSANTDPTRNNMTVVHQSDKVYTDIVVKCLLDYGEPSGQQAFDNTTDLNGPFVFDEIGLKVWNGSASNLLLVSHVVFSPIQKSLNRQLEIDYTIRVQTLSHLVC